MKLVGFLFSAALFETGVAIGVAPYGMGQGSAAEGLQWNSTESLRTRRARAATNVAVSKASVRASAGLATEVLDDLTRKSRVTLAHSARKAGEHKLITWNAGGGAPQPEFLGGPWEEVADKMYSDIEQMTGALLLKLGECPVTGGLPPSRDPKADPDDLHKYHARYNPMTMKLNAVTDKDILNRIEALRGAGGMSKLLKGLKMQWSQMKKEKENTSIDFGALPAWADDTCTSGVAIGKLLKLCPETAKIEDAAPNACKAPKKIDEKKPDAFGLGFEGCWKKRGALPLYGSRWFDLYGLQRDGEEAAAAYWQLYIEGLQAQGEVEEKGCTVPALTELETVDGITKPKQFPKKKEGRPGLHVLRDPGAMVPYPKEVQIETPAIFTFEEWSKTALWDTLLMELTALSVDIIGVSLKEDTGKYKVVPYLTDTKAGAKITEIVQGALVKEAPDVVFLQEAKAVKLEGATYMANPAGDTAIYAKAGFDVDASGKVDAVWREMMDQLFEKMEKWKLSLTSAVMAKVPQGADKNDKKVQEAARKQVPLNGIYPKLTQGFEKKQLETHYAQVHDKGLAYADPKMNKLVTIAVANSEPRALVLSIHADSDGFYCAQYLHIARKFFEAVKGKDEAVKGKDEAVKGKEMYNFERMYIGMDANVQPPGKGGKGAEGNKGFTFDQLQKALGEDILNGMLMLDPERSTVKKVRSFLQTQFSKIGKDDDQKKDLLFIYPEVPFKDKDNKGTVYNVYNPNPDGGFDKLAEGTPEKPVNQYYPKNEWPVDHFMSMGTVAAPTLVKRLAMRLATAREDCAVKRFFDKAVTKTKKTVKAAYDKLCNLVKPKTDAKPTTTTETKNPNQKQTKTPIGNKQIGDTQIETPQSETNKDPSRPDTPTTEFVPEPEKLEEPKEETKPKVELSPDEKALAKKLATDIWNELGNEVKK